MPDPTPSPTPEENGIEFNGFDGDYGRLVRALEAALPVVEAAQRYLVRHPEIKGGDLFNAVYEWQVHQRLAADGQAPGDPT